MRGVSPGCRVSALYSWGSGAGSAELGGAGGVGAGRGYAEEFRAADCAARAVGAALCFPGCLWGTR